MKKVLAAWKERDACTTRKYGCGNEKNDKKRSGCGGDFGKGLVGFLSSTSTMNTWSGECPCVNATVHGAVTSTPDGGVTFQGSGTWAEWPVGKQGNNQLYHFANYKFTLVATVSIPEVMEGIGSSFPLMGLRMNDHKARCPFDLLYAKKNNWEIIFNCSRLALPADAKWELNTTHRVGLEMDYFKELLVYVDGLTVYDGGGEDYSFFEETKTMLGFHSVSHF
ncbi:putative trans-sialidase [Trypanosoma cruzi]|nr:putative trans-sialidase [Trypanosoma cruzi]